MHPLSRLCAVAFALAFLVGLPYVLLWHVAWPELPASWDVALAHLRGWRTPPGVLPAALIAALWVLWGLFALAVTAEAVARLRGIPLRLRPLGPLQAIAATAVAATAITPAVAFADTVSPADDRDEEAEAEAGAADHGDGAPEAPQSVEEQGPVERARTVSGFELGSAELTERMREDLAPTVEMIGDHWDEDVPVEITGHTDPSGDPDRNQVLSEERAQTVADYLEESLGEDAPDTEVSGMGSDQSVEGPPESQRRVEIAYTLAPAPAPASAPQQESAGETDDEGAAAAAEAAEEEAEAPVVTVDNASAATEEDGPRVVVLEVPDGAVAGAVGFVGLAGGYLLGKRGTFVPRMALSLPRLRLRSGRPRHLALPPPPGRPVPDDEIDGHVTVELDHVPGLGLSGKGADAAVRRLIANALNPLEPLAVRILITEGEAVRLLGETGRDLLRDRPCDPVTMVPTLADALAVMASELHDMTAQERAPLALITSPDPQHEHALSGLLLHGQHRGVTAVILGSWPLGGNCVVDLDGLISQTSQPLATLFHCSWAGSTAEEVREAVLAYHEADHALSERPERPSSRRDTESQEAERVRPVLVAEDWDDDDAFTPVGDNAVWDRLTRAWDEEFESLADDGFDDAEVDGVADAVADADVDAKAKAKADVETDAADVEVEVEDGADAGTGVADVVADADADDKADAVEGVGTAAVDDHDDSWWDETPLVVAEAADRSGVTDELSPPTADVPLTVELDGDRDTVADTAPAVADPFAALAGDRATVTDADPAVELAEDRDTVTDTAPAVELGGDTVADVPLTVEPDRDRGTAADTAPAVADPFAALAGVAPRSTGEAAGEGAGIVSHGAVPAEDVHQRPEPRRAAVPVSEAQENKEVRHQRVPGRKAGRVRVVRVDRPTSPEQGERSAHGPVRPRAAQQALKDTGTARRAPQKQARTAVAAQVLPGQGVNDGETPLSDRPQPAKPRKAGRGQGSRPRVQD